MAEPLVLLLAAVLVAGGLTFSTSASSTAISAEPAGPTDPLRPPARPGPFSMNLYESGDFVHQQTAYWCVAASVQTMINIIEPGRADRSRRTQRQLHFQGRRLDQDDDALRLRAETVIRNYDPCISCATHFLRLDLTRR